MSVEDVKKYLDKWGRGKDVLEFDSSSATVELAAAVLGVESGRIAKTLSFKQGEGCILIVTAGDTRIDNSKFKAEIGCRASMLSPDEVLKHTGYAVGGCARSPSLRGSGFMPISRLKDTGQFFRLRSSNSAIELTVDELTEYAGIEKWVDVCKTR